MDLKQIVSLDIAKKWQNGSEKELKELAFYIYPELAKKELPKKWEELENIKGWYISSYSQIFNTVDRRVFPQNYKVFDTENQAKSALAMAKLSQLMGDYNDGWVADWSNEGECKYCIVFVSGSVEISFIYSTKHFLAFKTEELAKEFLSNFREDIETYFNF